MKHILLPLLILAPLTIVTGPNAAEAQTSCTRDMLGNLNCYGQNNFQIQPQPYGGYQIQNSTFQPQPQPLYRQQRICSRGAYDSIYCY